MKNKLKSDTNNIKNQSLSSKNTNTTLWSKNGREEGKSAGCNDWNSVPVTYDKDESRKKHEKTATDNQWTSTHK